MPQRGAFRSLKSWAEMRCGVLWRPNGARSMFRCIAHSARCKTGLKYCLEVCGNWIGGVVGGGMVMVMAVVVVVAAVVVVVVAAAAAAVVVAAAAAVVVVVVVVAVAVVAMGGSGRAAGEPCRCPACSPRTPRSFDAARIWCADEHKWRT